MDLQLKGKRAAVLGGTRGIGRAIAETLAAEGADVAVCARNREQVDEAVAALSKKGVRATGAAVDIAKGPELRAWIDDVAKTFGGLDILVSNASALTLGAHAEVWESMLKIDILGAVNAFEAARPHLEKSAAERGDASFVMISSVSAAETQQGNAYGAVKAALIHYAKGLARECAKRKVRVNVVSPGTIYFKGGVWHMIEQSMPRASRPRAANSKSIVVIAITRSASTGPRRYGRHGRAPPQSSPSVPLPELGCPNAAAR